MVDSPLVLLNAAAGYQQPATQDKQLIAPGFLPSKFDKRELTSIPLYVIVADVDVKTSKRQQHTTVPLVEGIVWRIKVSKLLNFVTGGTATLLYACTVFQIVSPYDMTLVHRIDSFLGL
ncbi:hypothetical protein [Burkholderia sp. JKS000303]|uniref:hypothetical protein n=1 Tax=Burkholderia sp. JKS000303 TaxID=1938747 RepID=UPI00117F95FB|nr:hypothetical protein [Burkholderia sp. JKS000303]